ncbi:MAG: hypothetical protein ACLPXM_18985 [Terriglobales bacterium]
MEKSLKWPRRIIFSRKGFDSTAGGVASPIFDDGTMVSMPIPDEQSGVSFAQVYYRTPFGTTLAEVLPALRCTPAAEDDVHLDPDLRREARKRRFPDEWLPIFGQSGGAQAHLENNKVDDLDLFLFYGYFKALDIDFQRDRNFKEGHVIFGWLQVGKRYRVNEATRESLRWAADHPHLKEPPSQRVAADLERRKWKGDNNTVFVAREHLSFLPSLEGGGIFPTYDTRLCLTAEPSRRSGRSFWVTRPAFLAQRTKHRQEHVVDVKKSMEAEVKAWLKHIFQLAKKVS